jgi:hypothetical protein
MPPAARSSVHRLQTWRELSQAALRRGYLILSEQTLRLGERPAARLTVIVALGSQNWCG